MARDREACDRWPSQASALRVPFECADHFECSDLSVVSAVESVLDLVEAVIA